MLECEIQDWTFEVLDLPDLKHREFISEGSVTFAIGNLSLHR